MSFNFGSFGAGGASQPSGGFSQPSGRFSVFGGTSATPGQQQHATSPSTNIGEGTETSFGASTSALAQPTLRVPSYNELFPGRSIGYKIDSLLRASTFVDNDSQGAILAGQELIYLLNQSHHDNSTANRLLQHPNEFSVLEEVQPDHALRQRLAQCPLITLTIEQEDGSLEHREATLAPNMLQDVCTIADDLQISEVAAICLYQQAAAAETPFRSRFVQDLLIDGAVTAEPSSIAWMAREIYAAQSPLLLRTCLTLLQHRLREGDDNCTGNPVSEATDALLQSGWIDNFIRLVRDYTKCIKHVLSRSNTLASGRAHGSALLPAESRTHFWRHEVTLQICFKERQLAVECLFFVAYRVQMKVDEVVALIDLVRELMDGSVVLNPYTDVPDPFETFPAGSSGAISFMGNATSAAASPWFMQQQQQKEKDPLAWQQELATTAWKTGQPQLLRCASTLVMAVVSALGDRAVLMDRMTHAPNAFGRVRS